MSCHGSAMDKPQLSSRREDILSRIKEARAEAIEHTIAARRLSAERRHLMEELMKQGVSQAEIARQLGVSRQAIQKMLAC